MEDRFRTNLIVQDLDTVLPLKGLDDSSCRPSHAREILHVVEYQEAADFQQAER